MRPDPVATAAPLALTAGGYQQTWLGVAISVAVDFRTPPSYQRRRYLTHVLHGCCGEERQQVGEAADGASGDQHRRGQRSDRDLRARGRLG